MAQIRVFLCLWLLGFPLPSLAQTCPLPWGVELASLQHAVEVDPRVRLAQGRLGLAEMSIPTSVSRPAPEIRLSGEIPSDPLASVEPLSVGLRFRTGRVVDSRSSRLDAQVDRANAQQDLQVARLEVRADLLNLVLSYHLAKEQRVWREKRAEYSHTTCRDASTLSQDSAALTSLEVAQVCLEAALMNDDVIRLRQLERNLQAELRSLNLLPTPSLAPWVSLPEVARLVETSRNLHPDIDIAQAQLALSQAQLRTGRLSVLPHVSFVQGGANLLPEGRSAWTWGLGLEVPVPGWTDHTLTSSRAELKLAELTVETTTQEVERRIGQAWLTSSDLTLRAQQWGGVLIPAADRLQHSSREALAAGQIQLLDAWKLERQALQIHDDHLDMTRLWWETALELEVLSGGALSFIWQSECQP